MSTLLANEPVREDGLGTAERFVPGDMMQRREEIERLWLSGHTTKEIAAKLGGKPLDVARNLREVRKRWDRATQRQQIVQAPRCIDIYQQSMDAWQRSQRTKTSSTKQYVNDRPVKVTVRESDSTGDTRFLRTAMAALKSLDQAAEKRAAMPPRARKKNSSKNELIVAMLNLLTPEQLRQLDAEQVAACREAAEEAGSVERVAESVERVAESVERVAGSVERVAESVDRGACGVGREEGTVDAAMPQRSEVGEQRSEVGDPRSEMTRTNQRRKRRSRFSMAARPGNFIAQWRRSRPFDPRATGRRRNRTPSVRRKVAVPQPTLLDVYSASTRILQGSVNGVESLLCGENGGQLQGANSRGGAGTLEREGLPSLFKADGEAV